MSDFVAPMLAGELPPVYEVLEIDAGPFGTTGQVAQRLIRFGFFSTGDTPEVPDYYPAVTIGQLNRVSGGISFSAIERRDVMLDPRPAVDSEVKENFPRLDAETSWRIDGETLVLEEHGADGDRRTFTYTRRSSFSVQFAHLAILVGETTGTLFPCFVAKADAEDAQLTQGLAPISLNATMRALLHAKTAYMNWEEFQHEISAPDTTDSRKTELRAAAPRILNLIAEVKEAPPLKNLMSKIQRSNKAGTLFGCSLPWS